MVAPYASMDFKVVPWIAPKYSEAAMQLDDALGAVSIFSDAAIYAANAASSVAKKVDSAFPLVSFGDLITVSRYLPLNMLRRTSAY